jgi:hypothetical protein
MVVVVNINKGAVVNFHRNSYFRIFTIFVSQLMFVFLKKRFNKCGVTTTCQSVIDCQTNKIDAGYPSQKRIIKLQLHPPIRYLLYCTLTVWTSIRRFSHRTVLTVLLQSFHDSERYILDKNTVSFLLYLFCTIIV